MEPNSIIARPRERHDGWTSARRELFVSSLAAGCDVRRSCKLAGKSRQSAYRLRERDAAFAAAWDDALRQAQDAERQKFLAALPEFLRRTLSELSGPCHLREDRMSTQDTVMVVNGV